VSTKMGEIHMSTGKVGSFGVKAVGCHVGHLVFDACIQANGVWAGLRCMLDYSHAP
jgi:hypothetical protein